MPRNKIVVRYADGRLLKGHTDDFLPAKATFHLTEEVSGAAASKPVEIRIADLKAVFFVRDLTGKGHPDTRGQEPAAGKPGAGRRIRVEFNDGEVMVGSTQGYDPSRPGFFLVPADLDSNNERCFVIAAAARKVSFL
jgi:hypothetical protein